MIDAILQTKLHPPLTGSASLVQRQRLLDRLDRTFHCKLAVVAAPAGYGKSTLALAWKERLEQPVAWLSLDEDDNDPRRFITYVVAALNYILPEFGTDLLHLLSTAGQELPIESISTVFLNQLSKLEMPTVLVLDDYHVLELPAIHEIVAYWLEHLPPALHLLLVSRSQPDLPLSRLRAGGQLVEIDQQALRFTRQETDDWLRRIQGIMLTDDEVNTLTRHTEGWPAGICLAALSLQDAEDRSRFVATFSGSNRLVVDYLVDEVLDQRSPETREFLLKTSILDRLTGSLCDALLQEPDQETGDSGQRMLEKLDATGLFILPLDNERRWYRYHSLFAELLQDRLQRTYPNLLPYLHARASNWYVNNDQPAQATRHALAASDWETAVQLIEENAQSMVWRGELILLLDWLRILPQEIIVNSPRLGISLALTRLLSGRFKHVADITEPLLAAEKALGKSDVSDKTHLGAEVDSIRAAILVEQGKTERGLALARPAFHQLAADTSRYGVFLRSTLSATLGLAYRDLGRTEEAAAFYDEARGLGEASDNIVIALLAAYELGKLRVEQGQLRQAEFIHREAMSWAGKLFGDSVAALPLSGAAHIGLGRLLYKRNRLDEAREHLELGVERARHRGGLGIDRDGMLVLALLNQAQNQATVATKLMDKAVEHARGSLRPDALMMAQSAQAHLWLKQGKASAAAAWLSASDALPCDHYPAEIAAVVRSMVYLSQGEPRLALDLLNQCETVVESGGRSGRLVEILVLQALAYGQLGEDDPALAALEQSLKLAEPEGYVRLYLDLGRPMAQLLYVAVRRQIAPTYAGRILAAFEGGGHSAQQAVTQPLVEPLSVREQEVLRLLADGLSNREIALRLYLSPNTIKRHASNIYEKLGVHNRTEAVTRARDLGILN